MRRRSGLAAALLVFAAAAPADAQDPAGGRTERVRFHAASLEGTLLGDPAERHVSVYLPPGYPEPGRRYPVLYLLHGYNDDEERWFGRRSHFVHVPTVMQRALRHSQSRPVIVVMPNARTRLGGSMYGSSAAIGDWESAIARDLVSFIDSRYRTMPHPSGRGLAGHSMGGYGALTIAMRHPGVFGAVYAMSPCCLVQSRFRARTRAESIRTWRDFDRADFATRADIAAAAAWSPNPDAPPFFADMWTRDGQMRLDVFERWNAHSPLLMLRERAGALRELNATAVDAADEDLPGIERNVRVFLEQARRLGLLVEGDIYRGTHWNRIAGRLEQIVLPFFWRNLSDGAASRD